VHWKILVAGKYHNLIRCTLNLTALYGSTCVVLAFSHVKSIKSKYRTTTDNHLVACLRLATSCYTPDCEKLAPSSQWQVPTVYGGNFIFSNPEIHLFCIWFIFLFGSYQGHCLSTGWWVYERVRVWERKSWRCSMWSLVVVLCVNKKKCCEKLLQAGNDVHGFAKLTLNR